MKRVAEGGARRPPVRRRSFTREFRRLVVKETLAPGASVSAVALKHRLNTNMVLTWRRRYLRELSGVQAVNLLPIKVVPEEASIPVVMPEGLATRPPAHNAAAPGSIEIEVYGACIRLSGAVDTQALRAVLDVLSGR